MEYSIYFVFTYFLKKPKPFHSNTINVLYEYINKDMDIYGKIKDCKHFVSWTYGAYIVTKNSANTEKDIETWLNCIGKMYRGYEIEFVQHATKYDDFLNFEISEF